MNSAPPPGRRFLPTLTEVVLDSEASAQCQPGQAENRPVVRVDGHTMLLRLDQLIDSLLRDEADEALRSMLAKKFEILRQCLHQEFGTP